MIADYRSDVNNQRLFATWCSLKDSFSDRERKPGMAPFEDITGQVVITGSNHLIRWLSQITADNASKSLRRLITLTEFTHPWGQHTIVRT